MPTVVDAEGREFYSYASCQECSEAKGITELLYFVPGLLGTLQKRIHEMKASIHEQATGHTVLVIYQKGAS